jgi:hypothetical protein
VHRQQIRDVFRETLIAGCNLFAANYCRRRASSKRCGCDGELAALDVGHGKRLVDALWFECQAARAANATLMPPQKRGQTPTNPAKTNP